MHNTIKKHINNKYNNKINYYTIFILLLKKNKFKHQIKIQTNKNHYIHKSKHTLNSTTNTTNKQHFNFSPNPQTISIFPLYINPKIPITLSQSHYPYLQPQKIHNSKLILPSKQYSIYSPSTTISHSHSF